MLKVPRDLSETTPSEEICNPWQSTILGPSSARCRNEGRDSVLCPVCGATCETAVEKNLSHCPRCEHIFQSDLRVSAAYNAQYVHQYDRLPCEEMSAIRWNFIQQSLHLASGSRILDVGYGNGAFLMHARRHDMAVFGLDVHGEDFGIPTVSYDTADAFDLVCFFDSLEHLPDFGCLFGLRAAAVAVSLPNRPEQLLHAPQCWRHYKPGEHLHYFSHASLDALMRKWGLPVRVASGFPEDALRGKLRIDGRLHHNIHTAIYVRG